MVFPTLPQSAQAEEAESKVSLSVAPVISLSLQDTVAVEVTPTQDGTFSSNTAALSISTNNETGYSLYMATGNGENTLTSQNPGTSDVISAVNGGDNGVTSANFTNNTWGYNLSQEAVSDATAYKAVPTATGDTALITTSSPTEADTYNLTFGTKVDTSLPSGTYSNDVVVSVVANPKLILWDDLTMMQDMNPSACAGAIDGATKRLTDARDGKQYWIAKLKDGNCWMTQNLDLNLSTSKALTPDDSDVSRSWAPANNTLTDGTQTTSDYEAEWSWNLGDYVLTTPNAGTSCGISGISDFGDCTSVGFQSVAGMTPMTDGDAADVISGNTYNAHYHVGNHYTWNAATAGTGGADVVGEDATDSICPKGWQLPTSNHSNSASFKALTNAYSISSNTDGSTALVSAPLYFVRSGYVYSGSLRFAGSNGHYWSSTAYSSTSNAYYLRFFSGAVYPSNNYNRYLGQSVRCLAR